MPATVTIQCRDQQSRSIPAVWVGENLAVHRPLVKGAASKAARHWAITHTASGLAACSSFDGPKSAAVNLARLWDKAFGTMDANNSRAWPYCQTWIADVRLAQWHGTERPNGPVLPDHPKPSDVAAAVAAAVGATYEPVGADESGEPFAVAEILPADCVRIVDGWPEVAWRGQWWPVPTVGEVESMAFDSVAESPDGRTLEPDHPESWLSILGIV
jgi:hypothetical protein